MPRKYQKMEELFLNAGNGSFNGNVIASLDKRSASDDKRQKAEEQTCNGGYVVLVDPDHLDSFHRYSE